MEINPVTRVPVAGAWYTFLFMAGPAFFLDLEQITKIISCGNLMTYSFVTGCGIALRFRERETQNNVRSSNEFWVWAYMFFSFIAVMSVM